MKPTMGDSKVNIASVEQATESKKKTPCLSRPAVIVVVVFLAIVVIGSVVITAMYVGGMLSQDKEGWVKVKQTDGEDVEQKMTVSESEEEVYVPGVYRAVFDFRRSLLVVKNLREHPQMCLLLAINTTNLPKPREVMGILDQGEYQESPDDKVVGLSAEVTEAQIDNAILSEKARNMCKDQRTFWAIPSCSAGRTSNVKRATEITTTQRRFTVSINLLFVKFKFSFGRRTTVIKDQAESRIAEE